ncbi:hypothetical protein [uncultured Alloprevotella sp.]|uniref:hypothetical protein n=1 Tax=uncultured Alloprevotella sp. TaxID=1283315 RepID=UPI00261B6864|nr:hypothetical protein [uncultured Alloprevotella sp.]
MIAIYVKISINQNGFTDTAGIEIYSNCLFSHWCLFLSVHYTDKLIIGERRLINKWQVLYHFTPIPPRGEIRVNLPLEVFKTYDYVIDIDMKQLSIFQDDIKFKRRRIKKLTDIAIEFAFYDQINLLNSESFYKNEFKSGEQALNYNILEIFYHQ